MTTDVIWLTTTTLSIFRAAEGALRVFGLALLALKTGMVPLAFVRVPVKTQDRGFENRRENRANG